LVAAALGVAACTPVVLEEPRGHTARAPSLRSGRWNGQLRLLTSPSHEDDEIERDLVGEFVALILLRKS
jgi:hypothetical protein